MTSTAPKGEIHTDAPGVTIPGGSCILVGGEHTHSGPMPEVLHGNDWWQLLPPGPGAQWSQTLYANASPRLDPPGPSDPREEYVCLPAPPLTQAYPIVEYYVRQFFLANPTTGQVAPERVKNLFMAYDITAGTSPCDAPGSNPTGLSWIAKPRYHDTLQPDWELWNGDKTSIGSDARDRFYGGAVLRHDEGPSGRNRVLLFGGSYCSGGSPNTTIRDDVEEWSAPGDPKDGAWVNKGYGLLVPRYMHNSVVLPTGEILLIGGICGFDPATLRAIPASCPELYDPGVPGSTLGASSILLASSPDVEDFDYPYPRMYHSVGVLMADGRVFSAGGVNGGSPYPESRYTGEVFSPPYIGHADQPQITGISASDVPFGQQNAFEVTLSYPNGYDPTKQVDAFVLLRPAAVTHHFDADQRYIELMFEPGPPGATQTFTVLPPEDDLGPPGYYMLFAVRQTQDLHPRNRVPSETGVFVRLY